MSRRSRIRPHHIAAALASLAAACAWTSYATAQSHHTNSGAWDGWIVLGWLLIALTGALVVLLAGYGLCRLVWALWLAAPPVAVSHRTPPGVGARRASLSPQEWAAVDAAHRNVRIANTLARAGRLGAEDDTQLMLLADLAELDSSEFLIDAVAKAGLRPGRVVRADAAGLPPSQRSYPEPSGWVPMEDVPLAQGVIARHCPVEPGEAVEAPSTVWTVEPAGLSAQGVTLRGWFGDAFERRAA